MPRPSRTRYSLLGCTALALLPGCYRATLQTGLRPAPDVRERVWAKPFSMAEASVAEITELSGCPAGVAKVETTRTLLDQLAGLFDGGASSGVRLLITCAAVSLPAESPTADSTLESRSAAPDSTHTAPPPLATR